jgi:hypothetical protein
MGHANFRAQRYSVVAIQRGARGRAARQHLRMYQEACRKLQSLYRGRQSRQHARELRIVQQAEDERARAEQRKITLLPWCSLLEPISLFQCSKHQAQLLAIAGRLVSRSFAANEVILSEGEPAPLSGDAFYVIEAGEVTVTKKGLGGPCTVLGPGEYFGELALIGGGGREATVTSSAVSAGASPTAVKCLVLSAEAFQDYFRAEDRDAMRMEQWQTRYKPLRPKLSWQDTSLHTLPVPQIKSAAAWEQALAVTGWKPTRLPEQVRLTARLESRQKSSSKTREQVRASHQPMSCTDFTI